jgi:putative PIG3 family NAD(P)H quinone oxidoreductase
MTMPNDMMRAAAVRGGKGDASALFIGTAPIPRPGPGEVLVKVRAAGVNRPDIMQREGHYPPPPGASDILGLEIAGEVAALGEVAERWAVGDQVTALLPGGGYADYALVDARHALPIPQGLDFAAAAALPETVFTVWTNLFERGRLRAGETALIHGANSGIGTTAIQMARAARAKVIATARGADKAAKALEAGADIAIDTTRDDFAAITRANGGADVILDIVGGDYFEKNIDALNVEGRLVQIAFQAGRRVTLDLAPMLFKRLTITASTLRARDAGEKARLTQAIEEKVWPWIAEGTVRPLVDRTFPIEAVADAHRYLEAGSQFGKVVLLFD